MSDLKESGVPDATRALAVVDDDEGLLRLVGRRLSSAGLSPEVLTNGAVAVQWAAANPGSLLLLDYRLPDMSAAEVVGAIRGRGVPFDFIVMTGQGDERVAVEMMKLGACDYLTKDALFLDLLPEVVRQTLGQLKTRERLAIAEERYHRLFNSGYDAVFVCGITPGGTPGRFIEVNDIACRRLGYGRDELLRMSEADIVHPEARSVIADRLEALRENRHVMYESVHVTKDGKDVPVEVSTQLFALGGLPTVLSIARDITGRKAAEELLRLSEQKFSKAFHSSPDWMSISRLSDGRYIDVNNTFLDMTGYSRQEVIGRTAIDLGIWALPDERDRMVKLIVEDAEIRNQEVNFCMKDGRELTMLWSSDRISFGEETCILSVTRDITERKRAEADLASEKERLAVTLRSIGDGVITTGIDGKVVLMNRAAEALTGWTQADAGGRPLEEVFHIVDVSTGQRAESPLRKVLVSEEIVGLDNSTMLVSLDGTERLIADSGASIRDADNRVIGVVIVFRDVTEKQKMEEELQKAQKLESVGILAGGIAHDFNNVLTAILSNISLAKMSVQQDDDAYRRLAAAERACLRAEGLTQQLLTFSKGGAPVRKAASVAELIHETVEFALRGSNVKSDYDLPGDIRPVNVDEGQISQVINNLIINADQAMPDGGTVTLRVGNVELTPDDPLPLPEGQYVRISVHDTGVGIKEDRLARIFDPYYTTKVGGSGLGLATTYSIIKRHEGHISVESSPGRGTTFHVYLPAIAGGMPVEVLGPEEAGAGIGKVLMMDDEDMIRDSVVVGLQALGYEAESACDGAEALEAYKRASESRKPFDVVIMDVTVPGGMGGVETIKELLKLDPEAKAVVSSGYSNDPVMSDYGSYGFRGVITKPYEIQDLSSLLMKLISS